MAENFNDFISEVKARADIVSVISAYVPLKRVGSRHVGLCPFHNDHSPSFNVTPQMGIYKCFVCGEGGDVLKFLQEYEKLSFLEALNVAAEKAGLTMPKTFASGGGGSPKWEGTDDIIKANSFAAEYFQSHFKKSQETQKYMADRGIKLETLEKFKIGVSPKIRDGLTKHWREKGFDIKAVLNSGLTIQKEGGRPFDRFSGRLMFPIWNLSNRIVGFGGRTLEKDGKPKYLNSPESTLYQKSKLLYGMNFARAALKETDALILVEGYMDVLSISQAGLANVIAVSGTALTEAQVIVISRFVKKVYLFLDGDDAGQKAIHRSLPILLKQGLEVRVPPLPSDQDPDSFALEHGKEGLEKLFAKSHNIVEFLTRSYDNQEIKMSPEEKNALFITSRDIIQQIPSEIVRMEYLEELMETLELPRSILKPQESHPLANTPEPLPPQQNFNTSHMHERVKMKVRKNIEWQLIQTVISIPRSLQQIWEKIDLDWFQDEFARDLMDRILSHYLENQTLNLPMFLNELPEKPKMVMESIEFLEIVDYASTFEDIKAIMTELFKRFKLKSMREINAQVKEGKIDKITGQKALLKLQKQTETI